jgi:glutathione S-transferase
MNTSQPKIVLCELGETGVDGLESYSPFCLKVHRGLRAAGLAYSSRHYPHPAALRPLNPAGQAPVLLVDDEVVPDSTAILARVERMVPGSLQPRDATLRAEAWIWEDWADRGLNGFLLAARWLDEENWPLVRAAYFGGVPRVLRALVASNVRRKVLRGLAARDVTRHGRTALWNDYRRVLDRLEERAPAKGFWLGTESITLADVALFAQLRSLQTPLTASQARELAQRTALSRWLDRVDEATRRSGSSAKS